MGKRSPVPALYIGPSDDPVKNFQRILQWSKQVSPLMSATGAAVTGTLPVPSAPQTCHLKQEGLATLDFVAGMATFTYPQPFPNGVLCILVTPYTGSVTATMGVDITTPTLTSAIIWAASSGVAYAGELSFFFSITGF